MKTVKVLIDQPNDHQRRIQEPVIMVNVSQNYFLLELSNEVFEPIKVSGRTDPYKTRQKTQNIFPEGWDILIISGPFVDNWFTHPHRDCQIITILDWEKVFAPPSLRAYLIYHFAEALLTFKADLSEDMHIGFAHELPQGCISDFYGHKPDVKLGMVAGNICPVCEGVLLRYGMNRYAIDALRYILEVVREESIGRPRIVDPDTAFAVMQSSKNDENQNAFLYGIKKGLEEVTIKVVRADDIIQSIQILDKVFCHIERARFVVAKVDVENLNVYFELGVAMGLSKDVLLIAERSLTINLPSDCEIGSVSLMKRAIMKDCGTPYQSSMNKTMAESEKWCRTRIKSKI